MAVHDPPEAAHLGQVVARRRLGRVNPEDRKIQTRHRAPQRIEARIVRKGAVAVAEEGGHREVEAAHLEALDLILEGAELRVAEGEWLVHLRQADEPPWPAPCGLREVLGEMPVDVIVLEDGGPDPGVVHLDDHALGGRGEVVHVGRQELDVVALPVPLPLEAARPAHAEADVRRPSGLRGVIGLPERPLGHDGVVAESPVGLVAVDVHGSLLVHEVLSASGSPSASQRREDVGVAVDDGEVGHELLNRGAGDRADRAARPRRR